MKVIQLTRGQFTTIDDEDYEKVKQYKWSSYYSPKTKSYYAVTGDGKRMHRIILGAKEFKIKVDHKNHDTLDNRKINLRIADNQQNSFNQRVKKNNTSGFKGVSWVARLNKWRAYIVIDRKQIYLGVFSDVRKAAMAYNNAAIKYFGEFALINSL